MKEVKLIGAPTSLFCTRVEWALKLKGVEYEYIQEDVRNKSPLLLKYNPVHKKVPVLVHRDRPITESLVILEYIDEIWKDNPLLPSDPYEKGVARFWARFADEKCLVGAWEAYVGEGEEREKATKLALESFQFLEKQIEGKDYFGGKKLGYLDLVVGWVPLWLGVMEQVGHMNNLIDPKSFPFLHRWSESVMGNALIKECLPPREMLLEYFTAGLTYVRSLAPKKA